VQLYGIVGGTAQFLTKPIHYANYQQNMKNKAFVFGFIMGAMCLVMSAQLPKISPLKGAWRLSLSDGSQAVMICSERYMMYTFYDLAGKKYLKTGGGAYKADAYGNVEYLCEFNTEDTSAVGKGTAIGYQLKNEVLNITTGVLKGTWQRLDQPDAQHPMAAAWRIREREGTDGTMSVMQRGPRKTIKILSGTRFQWTALNTQTKQMSGCGGGIYVAKDGKYTETIEFFSRDNNRVGASLTFDWAVNGKDWTHKGLSSTGAKVHEIWERED
jgi:hypothetical protein